VAERPRIGIEVTAAALAKAQQLADLFGVSITELVALLIDDLYGHALRSGRVAATGQLGHLPRAGEPVTGEG
jgi:hypothetical protein